MRHAVIAALATLVVACSILSSFDGIEPRPPAADAGADVAVGVDASAGPDAGCPLERWPGPPSNAGSTNDLGELTSAVSRLRVLDPVLEGKFQGFDLDGRIDLLVSEPRRTSLAILVARGSTTSVTCYFEPLAPRVQRSTIRA
jgi:hypothetical protein